MWRSIYHNLRGYRLDLLRKPQKRRKTGRHKSTISKYKDINQDAEETVGEKKKKSVTEDWERRDSLAAYISKDVISICKTSLFFL